MKKPAIALGVALLLAVLLVTLKLRPPDSPSADADTPKPDDAAAFVDPSKPGSGKSGTPKHEDDKPYVVPVVASGNLKSFVDRTKQLSERIPPDSTVRVQRLTNPADIAAVKSVLDDRKDAPTARNEAALYLMRSPYKSSLGAHLDRLLHDPNETELFRGYCVQHLAGLASGEKDENIKADLIKKIETVLDDKSEKVRFRAIRELTNLNQPRALEVAEKLFMDETQSPRLRRVAVNTIGRFNAKKHIPALRKISASAKDVDLKIAAIAELGNFKDEASRPVFEAAAKQKEHYRLRSAGQVALKKLLRKR